MHQRRGQVLGHGARVRHGHIGEATLNRCIVAASDCVEINLTGAELDKRCEAVIATRELLIQPMEFDDPLDLKVDSKES